MLFDLIPRASIGPFKLGVSQSETRAVAASLGFGLRAQHGQSDYFGAGVGIQVEYGDEGRVWFIGANNEPALYRLRFGGVDLFDTDARNVFEIFRKLDGVTAPAFDDNGVTFPTLIVTLWEADEQYDRLRLGSDERPRPVWGQIGIGSESYLSAVQEIIVR